MREPEAVFVTSEERLHLLGAFAGSGRPHLAPIAELLGKGVALTIVPQRRMFGRIRFPAPLRRGNWLAIVGDDLVFAEGPAGFHLRSLRRLLCRAHFVAVMAGAPVATAYRGAADIAGAGLNVVLIET